MEAKQYFAKNLKNNNKHSQAYSPQDWFPAPSPSFLPRETPKRNSTTPN